MVQKRKHTFLEGKKSNRALKNVIVINLKPKVKCNVSMVNTQRVLSLRVKKQKLHDCPAVTIGVLCLGLHLLSAVTSIQCIQETGASTEKECKLSGFSTSHRTIFLVSARAKAKTETRRNSQDKL